MNELEDTQPLQPIQLGWDVNGDGEMSELESKVPEPAILRACLFAVANVVGLVAGYEYLNPEVLERIINAYAIVGPLILGIWIRRHVSPKSK
ncbi:hypothetical protein [Mycobacteroides salmoniphilum]|uniref:hypothetical protein n=1 Tax=Mycobacteroides salmoniphilum TaxID=404941 RepID=UPI00099302A8|nr:hypothetical protein [Mycobacteroides salmoniphilum]